MGMNSISSNYIIDINEIINDLKKFKFNDSLTKLHELEIKSYDLDWDLEIESNKIENFKIKIIEMVNKTLQTLSNNDDQDNKIIIDLKTKLYNDLYPIFKELNNIK